jgi:ATP-dependent DNA ligase
LSKRIPGVKAPMPGFIEPQLATLKAKPPQGDYLHEIKFDGYRAQAHLLRGKAKIYPWRPRLDQQIEAYR